MVKFSSFHKSKHTADLKLQVTKRQHVENAIGRSMISKFVGLCLIRAKFCFACNLQQRGFENNTSGLKTDPARNRNVPLYNLSFPEEVSKNWTVLDALSRWRDALLNHQVEKVILLSSQKRP